MRGTHLANMFGCLALLLTAFVAVSAVGQANSDVELLEAPQDGGPRRLEVVGDTLKLFATPSTNGEAIDVFRGGVVLSNLGCATIETTSWCEVRQFQSGARGFMPAQYLKPAKGPDGIVAMGVDDSKSRARKRNFDAKSDISCAQERGQTLGKCAAGVARSGGGDATVVVAFPNGFARHLHFIHGEFIRASATMSGVGTDTDWKLENGLHHIRVDDQRFEVLQSFVIGEN